MKIDQNLSKLIFKSKKRNFENLSKLIFKFKKRNPKNLSKFKKWECTEELMKKTADGEALYMHCLPADITGVSCKEGEVAASVFEKYRLDTYAEAGHKPYIIAAMILLCRFRDPAAVLDALRRNAIPRVGL